MRQVGGHVLGLSHPPINEPEVADEATALVNRRTCAVIPLAVHGPLPWVHIR
jgi:hypothetical protein